MVRRSSKGFDGRAAKWRKRRGGSGPKRKTCRLPRQAIGAVAAAECRWGCLNRVCFAQTAKEGDCRSAFSFFRSISLLFSPRRRLHLKLANRQLCTAVRTILHPERQVSALPLASFALSTLVILLISPGQNEPQDDKEDVEGRMSTFRRTVSLLSPLLSLPTSLSRDFRRCSLLSTFLAEASLPSNDTLSRKLVEQIHKDLVTLRYVRAIAFVCD